MISIISGIVIFGAGGVGLWYFMPHNGKVHPLAIRPLLDSLIPIGIVCSFALGVALVISGAVAL